jgi:hypothetical protein
VNYCFRWKHLDGAIIEFGPLGWTSDDPEKACWLRKINHLSSSVPSAPPIIRVWIETYCVFVGIIAPTANDQSMPITKGLKNAP